MGGVGEPAETRRGLLITAVGFSMLCRVCVSFCRERTQEEVRKDPYRVSSHPRSPAANFLNSLGSGRQKRGFLSAAPQQSEICVKFSVFHTVFDVKFCEIFRRTPKPGKRSTENFTKISRQIARHLWS